MPSARRKNDPKFGQLRFVGSADCMGMRRNVGAVYEYV